jgi:WD40 repeat protein
MNYNRLEQHPFSLEWSPDGQTVAAGGVIANVYLWNAYQLARPTLLTPAYGRICINWHPNSQLLASRTRDGDVAIWDVATRQRVFNFQADQIGTENWSTIAWTHDGTTLVTAGQSQIFLWSLKNRELEVVAAPTDN